MDLQENPLVNINFIEQNCKKFQNFRKSSFIKHFPAKNQVFLNFWSNYDGKIVKISKQKLYLAFLK